MLLLRPLARFADFRGRASRSEYWLFMISQSVVYVGCVLLAFGSLGNRDIGAGLLGLVGWLALALLLIVVLALPNYAVLARRLHDTGRSAIWMALLLPVIATNFMVFNTMGTMARKAPVAGLDGAGFGEAMMAQLSGIGALGIVGSICSTVLFVLTLLPGTRGPNRFGPDPKDPDATAPTDNGGGLDEDRWDALIAEAKGARQADEPPYKPVFDFGPGPVATSSPAAAAPAPAVDWGRPAWDPGIAPSRPFGRRT